MTVMTSGHDQRYPQYTSAVLYSSRALGFVSFSVEMASRDLQAFPAQSSAKEQSVRLTVIVHR